MNTSIRHMRPDLARQFAEKVGMPAEEFFGEYEYTHKLSGRAVKSDIFPFHSYAFQEGLIHAENVGGDIESVLNQRCIVGAFPWRYDGLESCPCRIICFSMSATASRRWATSPRRLPDRRRKTSSPGPRPRRM